PDYFDQYPTFPADGTYPFIVSGTTIRYTLDGTDPTASSTEYTAPFEVDESDATDGVVEVRARAFHASYDDSAVSVSYIGVSGSPFVPIQTKTATSALSPVNSLAATFDATPTEGNLIVVEAGSRLTSAGTVLAVQGSGWNYVQRTGITAGFTKLHAWKIAGESESATITVDHSAGEIPGQNRRMSIVVAEFSGVDAANALDRMANSGAASDTPTTTRSTGTTDETATVPQLAIAGWAGSSITGESAPGARSFTNGFEEVASINFDTAARALVLLASKLVTDLEEVETTMTTANEWTCSAAVATFNAQPPIDEDPPVLVEAVIENNGNRLALEFTDESLPLQGTDESGFTLSGGANGPYTLSDIEFNGSMVRMNVSPRITEDEVDEIGDPLHPLFLAYDADEGDITDSADTPNPLASFAGFQVFNLSTEQVVSTIKYADGGFTGPGTGPLGSETNPYTNIHAANMNLNAGDTLNLTGVFKGSAPEFVKISSTGENITIRRWPGRDKPRLHGTILGLANNWIPLTDPDTSAAFVDCYVNLNIEEGLLNGYSIVGVAYDYGAAGDTGGVFHGMLAEAADLDDCINNEKTWFYGAVPGYGADILVVHVPENATPPSTSEAEAGRIEVCISGRVINLTSTEGGHLIDGVDIWLNPDGEDTTGGAVRILNGENSTVRNCDFRAWGFHAVSMAGMSGDGFSVENCTAYEGAAGNAFVHFSNKPDGEIVGRKWTNCTVYAQGLRDLDGDPLGPAPAQAFFAHADGGAKMHDLEAVNCRVIGHDDFPGVLVFSGDSFKNTINGADPENPAHYPVRFVRLTAENMGQMRFATSGGSAVSLDRCSLDLRNTVVGQTWTFGENSTNLRGLARSTVILGDHKSSGASDGMVQLGGGSFRFRNCIVFDTAGAVSRLISTASSSGDAEFYATQTVFMGAASIDLFGGIGGTGVGAWIDSANFVVENNWYFNIDEYTTDTNKVTQANWAANVETTEGTIFETDPEMTDPANGDALPVVDGALRTTRLEGGSGPLGINGVAYSGNYGAYQFRDVDGGSGVAMRMLMGMI
ncbi:MAG: hypothetical protein EA379_00735, partial [Phycisphaerales bacterium]